MLFKKKFVARCTDVACLANFATAIFFSFTCNSGRQDSDVLHINIKIAWMTETDRDTEGYMSLSYIKIAISDS